MNVVLAMSTDVRQMIFDQDATARLAGIADVDTDLVVEDFADPAHAVTLAEAEVLLTGWGCPPLTADVLDRMPRLRAVVHTAGTVKAHVTEACWERGIEVTSAASANALPVAEYTLAAILFAGKRVREIADVYRRDRTRRHWPGMFPHWGNYRLTVGVVGASRIGRRLIELLRPFDMQVLLADPYVSAPPPGVRLVDLDTLVRESDVVSVNAPELPETWHLFDRRRLALLRDGATLINTARGSLVDTDALLAELVTGRIHAVIDVTDPDVLPPSSPLFDAPNLLLTPHIAGSFGNEMRRMVEFALDELERFTSGQPFADAVQQEGLARSA